MIPPKIQRQECERDHASALPLFGNWIIPHSRSTCQMLRMWQVPPIEKTECILFYKDHSPPPRE